jgi:adenylate kinase
VLLGGPGSGKGTQAVRWAEFLDVPHISTGDLFRDHVERGSRLGLRAQRFMEAGAMLDQLGRHMVAAANIRVSDAELVKRLAGRGRFDDNPRTIRNRLRTFHRYNAPLIEYYRERGLLHEIDGEGDPDEVTARAAAAWAALQSRPS